MIDTAAGGIDDACPPPFARLAREGLAIVAGGAMAHFPAVRAGSPGGCNVPVLVFPGLLSGDGVTSRLRRSLDAAGLRAFGWGQGVNRGLVGDLFDRCLARLDTVHALCGEPVVLLGWSLGGLYARELAKLRPDKVRLVVTLCTPFSGDRRANNAWRTYELLAGHPIDALPREFALATKPPVPTLAVWSPIDGIVAPACARGLPGEADRAVMIRATHMGMGVASRPIRRIVALLMEELAERPMPVPVRAR